VTLLIVGVEGRRLYRTVDQIKPIAVNFPACTRARFCAQSVTAHPLAIVCETADSCRHSDFEGKTYDASQPHRGR
jgi:hypothetical protein